MLSAAERKKLPRRKCVRCAETKPRECFTATPGIGDGYDRTCQACRRSKHDVAKKSYSTTHQDGAAWSKP